MSLLSQDYCLTLSLAYKKSLTFQGLVMDVVLWGRMSCILIQHHITMVVVLRSCQTSVTLRVQVFYGVILCY